jgi:hypothetical protein
MLRKKLHVSLCPTKVTDAFGALQLTFSLITVQRETMQESQRPMIFRPGCRKSEMVTA